MKDLNKYKIWTGSVMMVPKDIMTLHQETVNGLTIGQWEKQVYLPFTGEVDKHGHEIYLSDIVQDAKSYHTGQIVFNAGCFWIEWSGMDVYMDLLGIENFKRGTARKDLIRVGDIYQHSEMLLTPQSAQ